MKMKKGFDPEGIVNFRVAFNSLQVALDRLEELDKDNFAKIIYQGDRRNLEKAKLSLKDLIEYI